MKPPMQQPSGMSPEFKAKIDAFEAKYRVDFTPKEEKQIAAADNPAAKAAEIAKQHASNFRSRQGGKFAPGRAGAAYYKQGGER